MPSGGWAAGGWLLLVLAGYLVGRRLVDHDPLVLIGAPPFVGQYRLVLAPQAVPAIALAVAAIVWACLLYTSPSPRD